MLIIILAYILGTIPGGYLLNRFISEHSYFNLSRISQKNKDTIERYIRVSCSMFADFFKGSLLIWLVPYIFNFLESGQWAWLLKPFPSQGFIESAALVMIVLGHVLSVYICGWGGRGAAIAFGGFYVLTPRAALWSLLVFFVTLLATRARAVWIASLATTWVMPVFIWLFYRQDVLYFIAALILALLSIGTHYRQLQKNEEYLHY